MLIAQTLIVIAFLTGGDVWTVSPGSGVPVRVTRTGGLVEDFRFSPNRDYLAYAKRIRRADERSVTSIVVEQIATGSVLTEIVPAEGWIDIDRWLGTTLMYHASAAMEVTGVHEYDAATGTRREVDPTNAATAFDRDVTADGGLLAYVDDLGLGPTFQQRLHLVDRKTGMDVVHVSKRSVMAPAIASDKGAVAFVEVVDGRSARVPVRDRVWVYRLSAGESLIYEGPVRAKGGGSGLTWAPDGRRIAMNFGGRTVVIDAAGTGALPRELAGADACWAGASDLVVASARGVEIIDVRSERRRLVAKAANRPQCLGIHASR